MMRIFIACAILALYIGFCFYVARRHRNKRVGRDIESSGAAGQSMLIAFASQTGFAEQLALQTARSLQTAGMPVQISSLATLNGPMLAATKRALFIVSTTGEGDAPDTAADFVRKQMNDGALLSGLKYGLLALGDSSYKQYCAFGRTLDNWLRHQGAEALFDRVEVNDSDEGALRHWQHHLSLISGSTELADWSPPAYERWRLVERRCLNAGSSGNPAFHIGLCAVEDTPSWQAGDIAEIGPRNAPQQVDSLLSALRLSGEESVQHKDEETSLRELLSRSVLPHNDAEMDALRTMDPKALPSQLKALPHREYSIASLPTDGRIELLIRQMHQADGRLGLGSGWLTEYAAVGAEICLRVRSNSSFHAPADERPLILIGNGTGMAGLRAHLKARASTKRSRNWLLFGERASAHDYFYRNEIESWQAAGILQRVDLAFSRDQSERVYVQHRLAAAKAELLAWVEQGAAIYVCGSLAGMSSDVATVLKEVLSEEKLEQLAEEGRYRRDVY